MRAVIEFIRCSVYCAVDDVQRLISFENIGFRDKNHETFRKPGIIIAGQQRIGINHAADVSGAPGIRSAIAALYLDVVYIYQMIQLGYMEIDYAAERVLRMTPLGRRVLYGEQKAQLVIYREPDELTRPVRRGERKSSFKAQPIRPIRSASTDETLLDSLRQLRKQIAEREHTPAYIIFSDDSLEDMVEKKPVTLDQFSDIRGVGQIKLDRYGKVFVALIRFVLKLPK